MASIIVEVIETTAASGLFIGSIYDEPEDLVAVEFFARVKCIDPEYPRAGLTLETVAVGIDEYEYELAGAELAKFSARELVHMAQFRKTDGD